MRKQLIVVAVFSMVVLLIGTNSFAQEAKKRWEILNLIRKEKFDQVLPGALRDNNVDMWIHAIRDGDPDPLAIDLGGSLGYFVFTDRGGDRIERAVFGGWGGSEDVYDIEEKESAFRAHVEERDPEVIAVNYSEWLAVADGISYTGYQKLVELLGDKYADRFVSAENVITDFRVRRTQSEIIAFANTAEMHRQIIEKAMSGAVITPGITTRQDVGWWIQDQILEQGLISTFGNNGPSVLYSSQSDKSDTRSPNYIYQPGDFLTHDMSVKYLNYETDYKRNAYILREG
jgi:Xaa-Pro dipeptidase